MRFIRTTLYLLLALTIVMVIVLYTRSDVSPQTWTPAPLPTLEGEFSTANAQWFQEGSAIDMPVHGPEDVTSNNKGELFTGLSDGQIVKFSAASDGLIEFVANTGGRPLGLQFDAQGNLIIADAVKGLLKLMPNGQLEVLVNEYDGQAMRFVDDLDIASDGTIWFSDATQRFGFTNYVKDFLEASFTGRLFSYDPANGKTKLHLDGLFFANGVALGPNENYVLVNETGTGRIQRYWLKGDRAGTKDMFHSGLPGNPDNLSFNGVDTFWVALPGLRDPAIEKTADSKLVRKLLGGLPVEALLVPAHTGFVLGLNTRSEVTHMIFHEDTPYSSITSVNQFDDRLYLGSLSTKTVLSLPIPPKRP